MLLVIDDQNCRLHSFLTKWPSFKKTTIRGRRASWRGELGELREPHPEPGRRSGVAELRPPLPVAPLEHIAFPLLPPVSVTIDIATSHRIVFHVFPFLFVFF